MESKVVFMFCLQLFVLKNTFAQCLRPGLPQAITPATAKPGSFSCQLAVQAPELPPPSFAIFTDGLIVDGLVSVAGSMPFLGTVSLNGKLPAAGQGSVYYGCGNGEVGIIEEVVGPNINEAIGAPKLRTGLMF